MGLELAERRLLNKLRSNSGSVDLDVCVVGRLRALRHARTLGARWVPPLGPHLPRAATTRADLVHLVGLDLPPPRSCPFVVTVHDLAPLRYDDEGSLPSWGPDIASRARLVLTPSAFTAGEIETHFGVPAERIRVFGGGPALDVRSAEPLSSLELSELGITPPFVLRYGGYTKRKNVPLLLEAWSRMPVATLVLAGPPQAAREQVLRSASSLKRVIVLDYVSRDLLARLLKSAALLVSTSAYEGFGLPPLEALAAGTPVIAVDSPFAREVCGQAGLLVDEDADGLARAMTRVLDDGALAESLRDAGLRRAREMTWRKAAETVLSAYREAASRSD